MYGEAKVYIAMLTKYALVLTKYTLVLTNYTLVLTNYTLPYTTREKGRKYKKIATTGNNIRLS